ncbi:MAG: hypothetical protein ABI905_12645 [Betaproteobacteria bacterium]
MTEYLFKVPSRFFMLVIGGGLLAGLLIFLAIQAMPVLGWILWFLAVAGAITGSALWYRGEFARARAAEDESHQAVRHKDSERNRTELRRQRAARRGELMTKYAGDNELVERIVLGLHWRGQTAGQLKDALGNPADIAAKVLKGRRQETWKYHPTGGDRYALWITLEKDFVMRWEERA